MWHSPRFNTRAFVFSALHQRYNQHSLPSRLLEINGRKKKRARPFFLTPIYFLAPATQAIINTSTTLQLILFADDTIVFVSHKDEDCLTNILNAELNKLSKWFRANRLSLNLKKTKFINIVFKPCQ